MKCDLCGEDKEDVRVFAAYSNVLPVPPGMEPPDAELSLVFYINTFREEEEPSPDEGVIHFRLPKDHLSGLLKLCADCESKIPWELVFQGEPDG